MSERDPLEPGPVSPAASDDTAAGPTGAGAAPSATSGTALRDRWWWSPTLAIVIGAVVIGYQLEAITGPDPLWLNWVVAAVGLAAAVYGAVTLLRAYRSL